MALEHRSNGWQLADRVGATASFLCAVHCALLPFVLAALPFVGLGFLADHRFERGFVLLACGLAALALGRGFLRHQEPLPLLLAVPGIVLLVLGVMYPEGGSVLAHSVLVTWGGLLLAAAHFVNLRNDRRLHGGSVCATRCAPGPVRAQ